MEGKKPVIGFICFMLSCILVIGITIGLLGSANNNTAVAGATADTTDTTDTTNPEPDNTQEEPEEPPAEEPAPEPEPELQWNYKFKKFGGYIDGGWIGDIAYKSQNSTFSVDNVTLTVSLGSLWVGDGPNKYDDVPEFDFYFADPSGSLRTSIYTVKTFKEQFFSEKFLATIVNDEENSLYYYYEYAHTEEITIPKELFTESEGMISMVIGGINVAENWHLRYMDNYKFLGVADIKYQLTENNQVVLSKPYDDVWHY